MVGRTLLPAFYRNFLRKNGKTGKCGVIYVTPIDIKISNSIELQKWFQNFSPLVKTVDQTLILNLIRKFSFIFLIYLCYVFSFFLRFMENQPSRVIERESLSRNLLHLRQESRNRGRKLGRVSVLTTIFRKFTL